MRAELRRRWKTSTAAAVAAAAEQAAAVAAAVWAEAADERERKSIRNWNK